MNPVSFGRKPPPVCRRGLNRETVALAGSALAITRSRSVVISDLSSEGAGLNGRDLPPPGEEILFVAGSTDRMADVVWRAGDGCGVHFETPLGEDEIERMKREAQWTSVVGCWR
jgi:alkanesulfonate monooxygenase SsuD/methylene tetrahydromethanopterin reductase-like flavin-dependent oxidoreductase (luciferase family)